LFDNHHVLGGIERSLRERQILVGEPPEERDLFEWRHPVVALEPERILRCAFDRRVAISEGLDYLLVAGSPDAAGDLPVDGYT
jgi:hypothetical protein